MTRTKPPEVRRQELLDAGARVLVAKGFAAATVDDITREAGLSKGAFYLHFESKDALLHALQDRYSAAFKDRLERAVASESDWGAKLDACVYAAYEGFHADQELHDALFRAPVPGEPVAGSNVNVLIEWMRSLLLDGIAAGAYRVDDPDTTAVLLFVAIHGFDLAFHDRVHPSTDQLVAATRQLFRRAAGHEG